MDHPYKMLGTHYFLAIRAAIRATSFCPCFNLGMLRDCRELAFQRRLYNCPSMQAKTFDTARSHFPSHRRKRAQPVWGGASHGRLKGPSIKPHCGFAAAFRSRILRNALSLPLCRILPKTCFGNYGCPLSFPGTIHRQ